MPVRFGRRVAWNTGNQRVQRSLATSLTPAGSDAIDSGANVAINAAVLSAVVQSIASWERHADMVGIGMPVSIGTGTDVYRYRDRENHPGDAFADRHLLLVAA
ncbi:MAG: hypothetical protein ACYCV7_06045 [Acidimicrobiales bacterium]